MEHDKVRQELECSVCLDQYKKPKLLGCMHTFCESCIEKLIQNGKSISCPQCRHLTKAPDGASGLSTNYIAQNIIEKLKHSARSNKPCCHDCANEIPATSHCQNCVLNLCKDCTNYHQRCVRFVGHRIVAVSSVPQNSVNHVRYCAKHKELLKYFCENCKMVVCNDCMISNQHKSHSMSLMSEAKARTKNALNQKLLKATEYENGLLKHLEDGEKFKKKVQASEKKSVRLVKQVFNEIRQEVSKREKQLIDKVKQESNFQSFQKYSTAVKKITDSLTYVKNVMKNDDDYDNMEVVMDLSNHLDLLDEEYNFNQKYRSSESSLEVQQQKNHFVGFSFHEKQQQQPQQQQLCQLLSKSKQNGIFVCEREINQQQSYAQHPYHSYQQPIITGENISFQMNLVERDLVQGRNHTVMQKLSEFNI